jgi:peroxiredoxin
MNFGIALFALFATTGCNNNNPSKQAAVEQQEHVHQHAPSQAATAQASAPAPSIDLVEGEPSSSIPPFKFYKVKSGVAFQNQDITKGRKTIFVLFDPSCSHCRTEANALAKNYNKIKDINLYFVSMNDPALMASFLETFAKELAGKPNIEVLYDRHQEFIQKFHVPNQFPANYVYSKDGQLEAYWEGDKSINDIIAAYTK